MEEQAMQWLEQLAQAMGVAAEHVYSILVRQMVAEGVVWGVIGVVTVVAFVVALKRGVPVFVAEAKSQYDDNSNTPRTVIYGVSCVVLGLTSAVAVFELIPRAVMKLMNPEYYAIEILLRTIGG